MKYPFSAQARRLSLIFLAVLILSACAPSQPPTALTLPTPTPHPTAALITTAAASATATPPFTCSQTHGSLTDFTLTAPMLQYSLAVKVYLPPCYSANNAEKYSVLYMLHGMADTNEQWVRLGLTNMADRLIVNKTIQPLIIVMPDEISWQLTPDQSGFGQAISEVLIPWVEENYAVCTERACRAIGGLSRGGNWAVDIGLENWQKFSAIGAHSTPLFTGGILKIKEEVSAMPSVADAPALYVDVGKKDENLNQVEEFEKTLTDLQVAHDYHLNTGYHDETYWGSHTQDYLLWYAAQLKK